MLNAHPVWVHFTYAKTSSIQYGPPGIKPSLVNDCNNRHSNNQTTNSNWKSLTRKTLKITIYTWYCYFTVNKVLTSLTAFYAACILSPVCSRFESTFFGDGSSTLYFFFPPRIQEQDACFPSWDKSHPDLPSISFRSWDASQNFYLSASRSQSSPSPDQSSAFKKMVHFSQPDPDIVHIFLSESFGLNSTCASTWLLGWNYFSLPLISVVPPTWSPATTRPTEHIQERLLDFPKMDAFWKVFLLQSREWGEGRQGLHLYSDC